jgi:dephospho-CoA kinase
MKVVGITGGIGSGKTTITKYIESLGYPVYIADDEAKKLIDTPEVIKELVEIFGEKIIQNNLVDKKKLATFVFGNESNLKKLNEIIHPKVRQHFIKWSKQFDNSIVVKEAAILFESGAYKDCNYTILVTASEDVRVERVISRDNTTKKEVLKRIRSQWSDEDKAKLADFVIENVDLEKSKQEIEKIIEKIEKIS